MSSKLAEQYQQKILPELKEEFNIDNEMAVPRVERVVINMGIGDISNKKDSIEKVENAIAALAGQKPVVRRAKKSISEFDIVKGDPVGLMVTLRDQRMYYFLEKLFKIVLPRVRDFQGVKRSSFDNGGNYTLGLEEQTIFPEIDYDKIDKVRGFEITLVTSAQNKEQSYRLLELLGMPFEKPEEGKQGGN
jgi:large subunit ribosomal protein L5